MNMQNRKILVVDDQRVIREVLKVYLSSTRASLLEASDGEQALHLMRSDHPDVVIADLQMPKLDGVQLCKVLQGDPTLQGIPVVILTGNADPSTADECRQAGAREVLKKPVSPAALLSALQRVYAPAS